jgi:transposase
VRDLYDTPEEPIFYDLTSSYFEGTECSLGEYGYSGEKCPDKQQVVGGVTVSLDMIPVDHDIYPGNTADLKTIDEMTARVDERGIDDPVLVMDRGCATTPVRKRLHGEDTDEDEREYVTALKRVGETKRCLANCDPAKSNLITMPERAAPLAVAELEPPAGQLVQTLETFDNTPAKEMTQPGRGTSISYRTIS